MSSTPSPDVKAVVRALTTLTTQVGRIADALTTPVVERADATDDAATTVDDDALRRMLTDALTAEHYRRARERIVASPEEHSAGMADVAMGVVSICRAAEATTPATTCSAQYTGPDNPRTECIRAAHHEHPFHTDGGSWNWRDDVAVYPLADSTARIAHWHPASKQLAEERRELAGMVDEFIDAQVQHGRAADEEQTLRLLRRESLLVLLSRLQRGRPVTEAEAATLRTHVETEIREADTARSVAAGNKRHVQTLVPALERAEADANHNANLVADAVQRAEAAERDLRTLRTGLRASGGDPTQIQNLWAQLRLRNRQWAEAKREARAFRSMLEEEGGDTTLVDEMLETVAKAEARAREAGHERDVIAADLETADRIRAEVQRDRDQHAAVLREVLDRFTIEADLDGLHVCTPYVPVEVLKRWRSMVAPTVERPWWEQVAEVHAEWEQAHAAIERVRAACMTKLDYANASLIYAALDGAEQPTEKPDDEALRAKLDHATATLRRVRTVTKNWEHQVLPHSEAHRLFVEVRDALAGPRPDPQPTTEA
ncbi:hypothetical protein [Streptomyces sp. NPDC047042]|uniref:hypothetical protein n=1 Tax=Streptomyces sp. NPDC047042 TaxID=3154807 RepID=UPI0033DC27F5